MKGRSKDQQATEIVHQAMLCKMFGCTPSRLRQESYEDLILMSLAYNEIAKTNPMLLFV